MDKDVLRLLEYDKVLDILRSYASSPLGRREIDSLCPSTAEDVVRLELDRTEEMVLLLDRREAPSLTGVEDLVLLLDGIHRKGLGLGPEEMRTLHGTLSRFDVIVQSFEEGGSPALSLLFLGAPGFLGLTHTIDGKIDERGHVRDRATPRLSRIRVELRSLRDRIRNRVQSLLRSSPWVHAVQAPQATIRGDRYVIPVRADSRGRVGGIVHDRSQTGSTFYVEPEELVESQNAYADLRVQEDREVSVILTLLTREILSREDDIRAAMLVLAHFDLVLARARYARDHLLTRPLVGVGPLLLKDARHPVLLAKARAEARNQGHGERESVDRAVSSVVPLDVRLLGDFHCLVITGPNTGGKTVALKTVGLLVLLTQSGLFVPVAPGSCLPVFDGVHADIGDEQSLEQSLSTFSSHMSRIASILRQATPRSLVLLDELGAGTDPLEGGALGTALLEVFHRTGVPCIVTTHLSVLKEFAYQHARAENACMEFDTESLRPTYRLLLGQPGRSNALLIARRLGLEEEVCDRAVELLGGQDRRTEEVIAAMERSRQDLDSRRQAMEKDVRTARDVRLSAEKELEEARTRETTLSREAEHEIDSAVRELRRRLEPLLARLRGAPRPFDELAVELESRLEEALRRSPLDEKRRSYALGLRKEDTVYLPRYGQSGRVKKVDRGREVVSVRVGALVVEVPFSDVSWIEVDRSR